MSNIYHPDFKYGEAMNELIEIKDFLEKHNMDISELVDTMEELADKETPMKPINQYPIDFGLGNYGDCQICNHGVNYQQNYCDNCGHKVDWNE